jgi:hypothetical protein
MSTQNMNDNTNLRKTIESMSDKIKLVDSDHDTGLEMFSYTNCNNEDSETVKQCRGVVFNKEQLVMKTFPFTPEYSTGNEDMVSLRKVLEPIFSKSQFFESMEGTLIRMFNFRGKWFISTHRKLNAFKSKWGSDETFGNSFKNAIEYEFATNTKLSSRLPKGESSVITRFKTMLCPSKQYMFLVLHSIENRIVCNPPANPQLYHVGSFVNGTFDSTDSFGFPRLEQLQFSSIDDLVRFVNSRDPFTSQGVVVFGPNGENLKVLNQKYRNLADIRGGEASLRLRYFQVRNDKYKEQDLYTLYSEKSEIFDYCRNVISNITQIIYDNYVRRYIKKEFVTVPKQQFLIMKEAHALYNLDRYKNKINQDRIYDIINNQTPIFLNRLVREYENPQEEREKRNFRTDRKTIFL